MIARLAAAALAATLAAMPAAAFERTRDSTTGKPLFWPVPVVPWVLNRDWPSTSPTCQPAAGAGDPTLAAVRASFAAWENASGPSCGSGHTSLQLVEGGTTSEIRTGSGGTPDNLVVFRHGWCSQDPEATSDPCFDDPAVPCSGKFGCFDDPCPANATDCAGWNVVALTSVLYDPATGRIVDADTEVNGWDGGDAGGTLPASMPQHGWYFTCGEETNLCTHYGDGGCRYMDLRNTLTHEIGHFIGLAHPCGESGVPACGPLPPGETPYDQRTMYKSTSPGEIIKRDLSADDIAGVCAIYPEADGGGGCGCGSAGAGVSYTTIIAAYPTTWRSSPLTSPEFP